MVPGLMNHQLIPNSEGAKFVRCDKLHSQTRITGGSSINFAVRPQSLVWLLYVFFCSDRWVSKNQLVVGGVPYLQFPGSHWGVCTALSWKLYGEYMLVFLFLVGPLRFYIRVFSVGEMIGVPKGFGRIG